MPLRKKCGLKPEVGETEEMRDIRGRMRGPRQPECRRKGSEDVNGTAGNNQRLRVGLVGGGWNLADDRHVCLAKLLAADRAATVQWHLACSCGDCRHRSRVEIVPTAGICDTDEQRKEPRSNREYGNGLALPTKIRRHVYATSRHWPSSD